MGQRFAQDAGGRGETGKCGKKGRVFEQNNRIKRRIKQI